MTRVQSDTRLSGFQRATLKQLGVAWVLGYTHGITSLNAHAYLD